MELFDKLNRCIEYLESILQENIDLKDVHGRCGAIFYCSGDVAKRLFPMIVGITVSQYLTKRKLTLAAKQIIKKGEVLNTAVEYSYETTEGFSKAFKKEFGILPSEIKKQKGKIIFFEKLNFKDKDKQQNEIEFEVVEKPEVKLFGRKHTVNFKTLKDEIKSVFIELHKNEQENLQKPFYAVCEYDSYFKPNKILYFILSDDKRFGENEHKIKTGTYLVFRKKNGKDEIKITNLIDLIYKEFADSKVLAKHNQEIEFYSKDFNEYWLPIE